MKSDIIDWLQKPHMFIQGLIGMGFALLILVACSYIIEWQNPTDTITTNITIKDKMTSYPFDIILTTDNQQYYITNCSYFDFTIGERYSLETKVPHMTGDVYKDNTRLYDDMYITNINYRLNETVKL
jgi:hypothetical protein